MTKFLQVFVFFITTVQWFEDVSCEPLLGEFSFKRNFDIQFKPKPFRPFKFIREKWLPFGIGTKHHITVKREVNEVQNEDNPVIEDNPHVYINKEIRHKLPYEVNEISDTPSPKFSLKVMPPLSETGSTLHNTLLSTPLPSSYIEDSSSLKRNNLIPQKSTGALYTDISKSVPGNLITPYPPSMPVLSTSVVKSMSENAFSLQKPSHIGDFQMDISHPLSGSALTPLLDTQVKSAEAIPILPVNISDLQKLPPIGSLQTRPQAVSPMLSQPEIGSPLFVDSLPKPVRAADLQVPVFRPFILNTLRPQIIAAVDFPPEVHSPLSGNNFNPLKPMLTTKPAKDMQSTVVSPIPVNTSRPQIIAVSTPSEIIPKAVNNFGLQTPLPASNILSDILMSLQTNSIPEPQGPDIISAELTPKEVDNEPQSQRRPSLLRRSQLALEFGSVFLQFLSQFFATARSSFATLRESDTS